MEPNLWFAPNLNIQGLKKSKALYHDIAKIFFFKKNLSHKTQEFIKIVTNIQQYCLMHAWNSEFKKNETEFPEQKFQNK